MISDNYYYKPQNFGRTICGDFRVITFELNDKHPMIASELQSIQREKMCTLTQPIYSNFIKLDEDHRRKRTYSITNIDIDF